MGFMRSLALALIVSLAILVGGQLLLPPIVSNSVENGFAQKVAEVHYLRAEVDALPAAMLLWGRADQVVIEARDLIWNGLPVAAFIFESNNLKLNPLSLWGKKKVVYQEADRLAVSVVLDEDGLNRYFWDKVDPDQFFRIELRKDQAALVGRVVVFGKTFELSLNGTFEVTGPSEVAFIPQSASVEQTQIPNFILDAILKEKRFLLPLQNSPVPVAIERVQLEEGKLFLYGTKRL